MYILPPAEAPITTVFISCPVDTALAPFSKFWLVVTTLEEVVGVEAPLVVMEAPLVVTEAPLVIGLELEVVISPVKESLGIFFNATNSIPKQT